MAGECSGRISPPGTISGENYPDNSVHSLPRRLPMNTSDRMKVLYCTDLDKSVLVNNFEKKGWAQVSADDDWNFYWAGTTTCRNIFSVDSGYRMNDNQ